MSGNETKKTSRGRRLAGLSAATAVFALLGCSRPAAAQEVDELIRGLEAADAHARATAACELERLGSAAVRRAMPQLLDLLSDGTPVEGRLCRDGYGWRRGWHDDSSPGREAAVALEEAGVEALDPLLEVLGGPSAVGRENAALALGLLESSEAVPALERTLRGDDAPLVRERAAWALGMIEDARSVPALVAAADDAEAGIRERAAWALGMIESDDGVEALLRLIGDPEPKVREQAAWALGMIESVEGVEGLRGAADDGSADVREQAAWALGMIESPRGVEPLVRLLRDEVPHVRKQAAWGLGMIEDPAAVDPLIAALGSDADAEVREQAAWALGMIEDPRAVDALGDAIEDEDEDVREQAMWALGMVVSEAGIETVDTRELARSLRRSLERDED